MSRLAIVDNDLRFLTTLRSALSNNKEIESVFCCDGGTKFIKDFSNMPEAKRPDVVLMDISMSYSTEGIDTTRQLKVNYPALFIIMFSVSDDDENIFEAFKAGAIGYLLKNETPEFIIKTIEDVKNGNAQMSPGIAMKVIRYFSDTHDKAEKRSMETIRETATNLLTKRELEILELASKGHTYDQIGNTLFIASGTVKKHISNIFEKLQVRNKIEAIKKVNLGII